MGKNQTLGYKQKEASTLGCFRNQSDQRCEGYLLQYTALVSKQFCPDLNIKFNLIFCYTNWLYQICQGFGLFPAIKILVFNMSRFTSAKSRCTLPLQHLAKSRCPPPSTFGQIWVFVLWSLIKSGCPPPPKNPINLKNLIYLNTHYLKCFFYLFDRTFKYWIHVYTNNLLTFNNWIHVYTICLWKLTQNGHPRVWPILSAHYGFWPNVGAPPSSLKPSQPPSPSPSVPSS